MNSGKGLSRHRAWEYHPLEFGISGEPGAGKSTLARRLAPLLGERVGVLEAGAELDPDEGAWAHLHQAALLVDDPKPGLVLPRLYLHGARIRRAALVGHDAAPVVASGPSFAPRRLPWAVPWFARDDLQALARFIRGYWDSQLANRPLLGLVLAGGRGGALGRDKASLRYGGQNQVERTFQLLSRFCAQTWVSCRRDQTDTPGRAGLPQIHDRYVDRGPMGGILSALDYRPEAAWLVVACDHPFLDDEVVAELVEGRDPEAAATSFVGSDGLPEPLCTIYEPKSRLGLLKLWALGYSCPRKLLAGEESLVLTPRRPEALLDVNTPREDSEARRRLGE